MVSVSYAGEVVTIGDSSIEGVNTRSTFGEHIPIVDAGTPLRNYTAASTDPLHMWRTQPSLRKVVGFIARNHASVPWHAYQRVTDTDRRRMAGGTVERGLMKPRRFVSGYKLWHDTVIDACLYDIWCVAKIGNTLQRISPRLLHIEADMFGNIAQVGIHAAGEIIDITDLPLALGTGWSPTGGAGVSPIATLANILDEQQRAVDWRRSLWKNGPKLSGVLKHPSTFKDPAKRDRFLESWRKWRDDEAGGTPILEDAMEYEPIEAVKPVDAKDIEGRQLTDVEVSSSFHVAPELVGARQGTFSNIAAFRQMLFGPALGPRLEEFQQVVNQEIVPALAPEEGVYAELDREAALNGSFMEQAVILSTSVGGPWMLRSEARAKANLPFVDGTDELIVPMNVTEGGLASPQDTSPTGQPALAPAKGVAFVTRRKAATPTQPNETDAAQKAIARVYEQQAKALAGASGVDPDTFHEAWDTVMNDAVHGHAWRSAKAGALAVLDAHNPDQTGWDQDVMRAYVAKMAESAAIGINEGVLAALDDVDFDAETDEDAPAGKKSLSGMFEVLVASGAVAWAGSIVADSFGFGGRDAAGASGLREKTWNVQSSNPRGSHAAMDGETVPVDQPFSNGLMWPGDSAGDVDEVAGCTCGLTYSF